jgi:hypothetical protein
VDPVDLDPDLDPDPQHWWFGFLLERLANVRQGGGFALASRLQSTIF